MALGVELTQGLPDLRAPHDHAKVRVLQDLERLLEGLDLLVAARAAFLPRPPKYTVFTSKFKDTLHEAISATSRSPAATTTLLAARGLQPAHAARAWRRWTNKNASFDEACTKLVFEAGAIKCVTGLAAYMERQTKHERMREHAADRVGGDAPLGGAVEPEALAQRRLCDVARGAGRDGPRWCRARGGYRPPTPRCPRAPRGRASAVARSWCS